MDRNNDDNSPTNMYRTIGEITEFPERSMSLWKHSLTYPPRLVLLYTMNVQTYTIKVD